MPGLDYRALRPAISIAQVLRLLRFRPSTRRAEQLRGPCPIHIPSQPVIPSASRSIWGGTSSSASTVTPRAINSTSGDWSTNDHSIRPPFISATKPASSLPGCPHLPSRNPNPATRPRILPPGNPLTGTTPSDKPVSFQIAADTQDKGRPVPPIPITISKEAQDFLRTAPPVMRSAHLFRRRRRNGKSFKPTPRKRGMRRSGKVIRAVAESVEIRQIGGVDVHIITPKKYDHANADKAIIHVHGGGFCLHTPESTYAECAPLRTLVVPTPVISDYHVRVSRRGPSYAQGVTPMKSTTRDGVPERPNQTVRRKSVSGGRDRHGV